MAKLLAFLLLLQGAKSLDTPQMELLCFVPVSGVSWANTLQQRLDLMVLKVFSNLKDSMVLQSHCSWSSQEFVHGACSQHRWKGLGKQEKQKKPFAENLQANKLHPHWHHWFSQSGWLVSRHKASQTHGLGLGNQETTIFFLPTSSSSFFFSWTWGLDGEREMWMSKSLCKQRVAQSVCHVNQEAVVCVLGGEGKESSASIPCHVWCSPHTPTL